jgi:hypothetical protein
MPDGDIVHSKLLPIYQKPYIWLCEGKADSDECESVVLDAFKRDLMKRDLPIALAERIGNLLYEISKNVTGDANNFNWADWAEANKQLEQLANEVNIPHRTKELILGAAKSCLHDIRYATSSETDSAQEVVLRRYMQRVYESDFEKPALLNHPHHAGTDAEVLKQRIAAIRPGISNAINRWGKQALKNGSMKKLRKPPKRHRREVDLNDDDLLSQ